MQKMLLPCGKPPDRDQEDWATSTKAQLTFQWTRHIFSMAVKNCLLIEQPTQCDGCVECFNVLECSISVSTSRHLVARSCIPVKMQASRDLSYGTKPTAGDVLYHVFFSGWQTSDELSHGYSVRLSHFETRKFKIHLWDCRIMCAWLFLSKLWIPSKSRQVQWE
jgi:hypothetical protein